MKTQPKDTLDSTMLQFEDLGQPEPLESTTNFVNSIPCQKKSGSVGVHSQRMNFKSKNGVANSKKEELREKTSAKKEAQENSQFTFEADPDNVIVEDSSDSEPPETAQPSFCFPLCKLSFKGKQNDVIKY